MTNAASATLTQKDRQFRSFALEDNMWRVVCYVGAPLALYQELTQLFKIADTMIAAHISSNTVSAVAYLSQINMMLSAIGTGLAVGGSLKISEAYGAGDYELVRRRVSSLFALCGILGFGILAVLVPFASQFLRFAQTPESFIAEGSRYFILELFGMVISFFNNVYIAIERARGNSRRILYLNLMVIAVKLSLSTLFVYGLNGTINSIALSTILSQSLLLLAAWINLSQKGNAFSFSVSGISFRSNTIAPMIRLSFPVIIEKMAFSFGKVIVNSMSTIYSALTVGALGISNNIGGFVTYPQNGFQEGCSAVISQNLGAGNPKRALDAFKCTMVINSAVGAAGMLLTFGFLRQISWMFAGADTEFQDMITQIYLLEGLGGIPLGIHAAVMGLLYGFGKTRITLVINFSRVFLFRIPVLWFLQQFTELGSISAGVVMAVSNIATGVFSLIIAAWEIRKICREYGVRFW